MDKQITYLRLWKVFLNPFNEIVNTVELDYIDDSIIINKLITNYDDCYSYIVVTAISKQTAEYKVRRLLWR
ncbi:MAG: hypothetical protein J6T10_08995 [Methanobrevibacter sp.]|nr:hypothetical protein [Methanobrevibacter sp.]